MSTKWDRRFFDLAETVATWSKDPTTKVGAVIVTVDRRQFSAGYNGFPRGVEDDRRLHDREGAKRDLVVHAELNAILNCPFETVNTTLYSTKAPCLECAKAIIQAGVERVVSPPPDERWRDQQKKAEDLFREAKVSVVYL